MDAEQRGWYIQLLAEAWESEPQATLPNDDQLLRVLAGANTCSTDVEQRWTLVKKQFKKRGAILYNERQMEEIVKQEVNRKKKSEAGRASAEARRKEREVIKTQHLRKNERSNKRPTPVENRSRSVATEGITESNSPIPSSISISISSSEEKHPAKKQRDERLDHPAMIAVLETRGSYPTKDLWNLIIEKLGVNPDAKKLKECWLEWRTRSYNPQALGWLTDWYFNGVPVNSQRRSGASKVDHSMDAVKRVIAEKEAQRDAERK